MANAPHGRFVLAETVVFPYRGREWADRIAGNRAMAYTLHHDPDRNRWYVTAFWRRKSAPALPLNAALAAGCIGVDMNDDHEDLDFDRDKTREKHGRRKRFRRLISRFPTARLRARLVSMAAEHDLTIVNLSVLFASLAVHRRSHP
ncbi:hypothetical protein [Streptomyces scopuliridis]|uniref:hypothetical protein n=1 Tax=Streptomyces scopuliridis TaxID=452529 RepID=UPI00367D6260